ncbi:siderophore-interacting protein [Nocardia sp. 348MFTsu5.1]|uniref:siderophore-interacting protein n=1 Tax=Nocardia sp. 348MFTsu5.1 TaxID=1172185 RepID=UPI0003763A47|nr:siderophore-interacting protein [Nocardia sp. 348MFTsu5.1]
MGTEGLVPPQLLSLPVVLRCLDVVRVVDVTPHMRRVTLGGEQLGAFRSGGHDVTPFATHNPDDYVKIFFADPETNVLTLPEQDDGHLDWPRRPAPTSRSYTIRRYDEVAGELDVDFVVHGGGVAGEWARTAKAGDTIHLAGPRTSTVPPKGAPWWILAGDETALPAIAHYLDAPPSGIPVHAFAVVPDASDEQVDIEGITWLRRRDDVSDGQQLAAAISALSLPDGDGWMWIAGEAGTVRELRSVAKSLGVGKTMLDASGYWRRPVTGGVLKRVRTLRAQATETLAGRL